MNQIKKILADYIYPTCLIFTVLVFSFTAIFFSSQSDTAVPGATPAGLGQIFLFSFLCACANRIFSLKKLPLAGKVGLHFAALIAIFGICFLLIGGYFASTGAGALYVLLAFALIYAVIATPILILYRVFADKYNKKQKYNKIFSKVN